MKIGFALKSGINNVDETGKIETFPDDKVEVKETDVIIEIRPGDWQTGNSEEEEIGDPEGAIRPGGTESNWNRGNKEDIVVGD